MLSVFGRENYDRANDDIYKQLKLISQVFTYIGYSSEIKVDFSLKGENLKINFFDLDVNFLINESKKYYKDRQDLDFVFDDFEEVLYWGKYFFKDSGVVFNFDDDHYLNNNLKKFSKIFHFFNILNFVDFNFYLKKNHNFIPLNFVSSGELHMLLNIIFIASNFDSNRKNIILIDEPEVSLHPKWQRDYAFILYDFFYLYDCQFFFATHSPLIISKAQYQKNNNQQFINYKIYKISNGEAEIKSTDIDFSIEALYWDVFRILTPQSAFLSRYLVELMTRMDNIKIDGISNESECYKLIIDELFELKEASFSEKQIKVINKIIKEYT